MDYTVKKSKRKTYSISVGRDGTVEIKAPLRRSKTDIEKILKKYSPWIEKNIAKQSEKAKQKTDRGRNCRLKVKSKNCFSRKNTVLQENYRGRANRGKNHKRHNSLGFLQWYKFNLLFLQGNAFKQ